MNLPTYISGTTQSRAYRLLREHVYAVLEQYDLTPTYWSMLGVIVQAQDGVRQKEIADSLHVKAPLVTVMSQELQRRGLVHSVRNQFDARAKLLALTPAGKKFVKSVEVTVSQDLEKLLAGLTTEDMVSYNHVLETIIRNHENLK